MSKMIQLRNVPDDLHRLLKARAAMAGMSLSDFLLSEVRKVAERPTLEEMLDRIAALPPVTVSVPAAEIIRQEREGR
ncbi:MAG TPA: hypothetical protein VF017_05425 [Thermoanaerobaculia bacterium]|nr:hypothetical protein [Thermoanaerobaculia bacterium]